MVVTGWVMRSIYRLVVLAKELRARVRGGLSGLPADRRGLPSAVRSCNPAYARLPSLPVRHMCNTSYGDAE